MQIEAPPATVWFLLLPLIGPCPGGVCYQSVKELIVEQNRHLKSDNNLSLCTLHTHLHTYGHTHSPPQCRQLYTVAALPMLKGWVCFTLHSLTLENEKKKIIFGYSIFFIEVVLHIGSINDDSSAVTALWFTVCENTLLSPSSIFTSPCWCHAKLLIFLEHIHMNNKMAHRGEVSWRERRFSIRSATLRCRICLKSCLLEERSPGRVQSHKAEGD